MKPLFTILLLFPFNKLDAQGLSIATLEKMISWEDPETELLVNGYTYVSSSIDSSEVFIYGEIVTSPAFKSIIRYESVENLPISWGLVSLHETKFYITDRSNMYSAERRILYLPCDEDYISLRSSLTEYGYSLVNKEITNNSIVSIFSKVIKEFDSDSEYRIIIEQVDNGDSKTVFINVVKLVAS